MSRGARIVIGVLLVVALLALIVQVFLKPAVRYTDADAGAGVRRLLHTRSYDSELLHVVEAVEGPVDHVHLLLA